MTNSIFLSNKQIFDRFLIICFIQNKRQRFNVIINYQYFQIMSIHIRIDIFNFCFENDENVVLKCRSFISIK